MTHPQRSQPLLLQYPVVLMGKGGALHKSMEGTGHRQPSRGTWDTDSDMSHKTKQLIQSYGNTELCMALGTGDKSHGFLGLWQKRKPHCAGQGSSPSHMCPMCKCWGPQGCESPGHHPAIYRIAISFLDQIDLELQVSDHAQRAF